MTSSDVVTTTLQIQWTGNEEDYLDVLDLLQSAPVEIKVIREDHREPGR